MLTKPLLFALLAACGGHSTATNPDNEPIKPPDIEESGEDQHFCCTDIDFDSKTGEGEGCVAIAKENINNCNTVLYCEGRWHKKDGKVRCL
jgi:hypothetical protein